MAGTLHNLSSSGPGEIKSPVESEVCKFCHIPHNAVVPVPLWGHALSKVNDYQVPVMRGRGGIREPAPQPDGASRLCLSCHDGTVALGQIGQGSEALPMLGAERLGGERSGYLGTDLSGSHPISFVLAERVSGGLDDDTDMALHGLQKIRAETNIRLDGGGKMQCTTCHDPHSDRYYEAGRTPHFWVRPTVDEVCLACHALR